MTRAREAWQAVRAELGAGPSSRSRKGVAIIIVLVTLAVLAAFTVEFQYKAYVGLHVASNQRDEVVAYYHARASVEVARVAFKLADQFKNMLAQMGMSQQTQNMEPWTVACEFANAFCTGKLKLMGKTFFDFKGQKGVGVEEGGSCTCKAEPEDGRVSINRVDEPPAGEKNAMFWQLYGVLDIGKSKEDRAPGEVDKELAETVLNIIDWADPDEQRSDLVENMVVNSPQGEGGNYKGDVKPKDSKFDTLAELQLVPGVTPELYCAAAPKMTPYPSAALNVNTAPEVVLADMICRSLPAENRLAACGGLGQPPGVPPTMMLAMPCLSVCRTVQRALYSRGFNSVQSFVGFFQRLPGQWGTLPQVDPNYVMQNNKLGVESRYIRIETTGKYFSTKKSLTAVIDMSTKEYVYWREY